MGSKSRGNFSISWDNGRDASSYQNGVRFHKVYSDSGSESRSLFVKVMETEGSDGSKLEKPMSKAYIKNIKSRKSNEMSTILPSTYGSGKKVPRD